MKIIFVLFILACLVSCSDEWDRKEPDLSAVSRGTLDELMNERGKYKIFLSGIDKLGFNDAVGGKGLVTIFAPDDDSMQKWLTENDYSSIDDMNMLDLKDLIGMHMVRYSYSEELFLNFPYAGAPNGLAHRHVTFAQDSTFERWDPQNEEYKIIYPFPKYLPVFTENMFRSQYIKDLEYNYKYFYPNSSWDAGTKIYAANAKPLESVSLDNGYFYAIDQVIDPLRTIYNVFEDSTLIADDNKELTYGTMQMLFDKFPQYNADDYYETAIINENFGETGKTLYPFYFKLDGPFSLIHVGSETTDFNITLQKQATSFNGFVPNDEALNNYFTKFWKDSDLLDTYEGYENLDRLIIFYMLNYWFIKQNGIIFPELLRSGLPNRWGYLYDIDIDEDVNFKEICSNGAFYGLNKMLIPDIFEGPTSPFFKSPRYKTFMYVLSKSGLLNSLVNKQIKRTMLLPYEGGLDSKFVSLNLNNWTLSASNVQISIWYNLKGNLSPVQAANYINYLSFPEVISEEELALDVPVWRKTNLAGNYLKVGNNGIETEDGRFFPIGPQKFAPTKEDTREWLAYELEKTPRYPHNLYLKCIAEPDLPWQGVLSNWLFNLMNKSTYHSASNNNFEPFAKQRGIIFAGYNGWCNAGNSSANVPKNSTVKDKASLNLWFDRHIIRQEENSNLNLLDFIEGNVTNTMFKTLDPDFNLRVVSIRDTDYANNEQDKLYKAEGRVGDSKYCMTLEIPAQGTNDSKEIQVYGPIVARDALCFIMTHPNHRIVWEDLEN